MVVVVTKLGKSLVTIVTLPTVIDNEKYTPGMARYDINLLMFNAF